MSEREQLLRKIQETKDAIKTAGPIHKKDLRRHLHRLVVQLKKQDAV